MIAFLREPWSETLPVADRYDDSCRGAGSQRADDAGDGDASNRPTQAPAAHRIPEPGKLREGRPSDEDNFVPIINSVGSPDREDPRPVGSVGAAGNEQQAGVEGCFPRQAVPACGLRPAPVQKPLRRHDVVGRKRVDDCYNCTFFGDQASEREGTGIGGKRPHCDHRGFTRGPRREGDRQGQAGVFRHHRAAALERFCEREIRTPGGGGLREGIRDGGIGGEDLTALRNPLR